MTDVEEERLKRQQGSCEVDDDSKSRVVITGASGLLGRAVCKEFFDNSWDVLGYARHHRQPWIINVDFSIETITEIVLPKIIDYKPKAIIHCAANSPEEAQYEYETARLLNVLCSKHLAYIADSCVLRIPVLYGNEDYISESDISSLFITSHLLERRSEPVEVSAYELKFPSFTSDVAAICYKLIEQKLLDTSINSIFHWCGSEGFTNYQMSVLLAKEFSFDYAHLVPVRRSPLQSSSVQCPTKSTQLSCNRLIDMGIGQHTPFEDGIKSFKDLLADDIKLYLLKKK